MLEPFAPQGFQQFASCDVEKTDTTTEQ